MSTTGSPPRHTTTTLDLATASDRTLMRHVAQQDAQAFEEIYRRHDRAARLRIRKLGASPQLAEEVTQEAFLAIWRGAAGYRPELGSVNAWLAGIARNRLTDAWRRAASRPVEVPTLPDEPGAAATADAADALIDRATILALLAELPLEQRETVYLAYFAGLTNAQIAARTGAPLGTVKGRLRLAIQRMRGSDGARSAWHPDGAACAAARAQRDRACLRDAPAPALAAA